jgi:hypothetical protein
MPRQRLHQKEAVGKLVNSVKNYGANVGYCSSRASGKWMGVARENPVDGEFEYFNPDLEDWNTDGDVPNSGAEFAKEWAMLWDGCKDQNLDRMLEVIAKMRPAGAVRADMDKAWEVFASVQCK